MQRKQCLRVVVVGLVLCCIGGLGWWFHRPSVQIQQSIQRWLDGSFRMNVEGTMTFGVPKDKEFQQVFVQLTDGWVEKQADEETGSLPLHIQVNEDDPTFHPIQWYDEPMNDATYVRYVSEQETGVLKDASVRPMSETFTEWFQKEGKSLDWKSVDGPTSSQRWYETSLSDAQTMAFVKAVYPSQFVDGYKGTSVLQVSLDKYTKSFTSWSLQTNDLPLGDVPEIGVSSVSLTGNVVYSDMQGHMPVWMKEQAISSSDSLQSLLDVCLLRQGFPLLDTDAWSLETEVLSETEPVLTFDTYRIGLHSDRTMDTKVSKGVWTGTADQGRLQVAMRGLSKFSGMDSVNAMRQAANVYYEQERTHGRVKEVNIQDVQCTNLGSYTVYWYMDQYTDCSESANGTAVGKGYHFFVQLDTTHTLMVEVLGISDIASTHMLSDETAWDLLSDVVIETMDDAERQEKGE